MNSFDFQSRLGRIYAMFPEAEHRPMIGVTANYVNGDAISRDVYYKQVVAAGGVPVLIPPIADDGVIINTLERVDALLLTGGGDYNPLWAGEQPSPALGDVNAERDLPELLITQLAYNRQIPMLGICRGIQTLAMALGGKVNQDINGLPNVIKHSQDAARTECTHTVNIDKNSMLYDIYDMETMCVNSFHHQSVADAGTRFRVVATAPDGVIEAMESSEFKSIIGVQWHPEWLGEDGRRLFEWLVQRAREASRTKELHEKRITLDSHCDTPMFFPQGIHFNQRDSRVLVDLEKMTEGLQDVVTMVAYLPQPKPGETFSSKVSFDVKTPTEYTDLVFDKIEDIAKENNKYVSITKTPDETYTNKGMGRKSIMLGIENGLALDGQLSNIKHFADRGIVYITLCHNGDNDICDSARGSATHDGVSEFGERVIREMNECGVMVDLSHASEKSFYDALDLSLVPIVCSHSNCRALCDVPRNLTDDQLRAIAGKGGVVQITLYHGFLRKDGEADINDAMAHLEHAIKIMGVDHVGLGTDFDGDGGIRGLANSSELTNFTTQLLRRKYSEEDIARIWGVNWLRVMEQAQAIKTGSGMKV